MAVGVGGSGCPHEASAGVGCSAIGSDPSGWRDADANVKRSFMQDSYQRRLRPGRVPISSVIVLALMTACVTGPSGSSGASRSGDCPQGTPMTALPEPRVRGVRDPDNWRSVGHSALAAWVVEFAGAVETRSPGSGGLDMDAAQASVSVDGHSRHCAPEAQL